MLKVPADWVPKKGLVAVPSRGCMGCVFLGGCGGRLHCCPDERQDGVGVIYEHKEAKNQHYARLKHDAEAVAKYWLSDYPGHIIAAHKLATALKYIARAGHKEGNTIESDLSKALDYLQQALELESKENK
jgi:hypothetical protein